MIACLSKGKCLYCPTWYKKGQYKLCCSNSVQTHTVYTPAYLHFLSKDQQFNFTSGYSTRITYYNNYPNRIFPGNNNPYEHYINMNNDYHTDRHSFTTNADFTQTHRHYEFR